MSDEVVPRDAYNCYYCHLTHPLVEAGGVWHCPNPVCTGPGAAYFRNRLKTYRRDHRGHTVEATELITEGRKAAVATGDLAIIKACERCVMWLEARR